MKKFVFKGAAISSLGLVAMGLQAEELNSKVINNYNALYAGYSYSPDVLLGLKPSIDAHGFGIGVSTEIQRNIILGAALSGGFGSNNVLSGSVISVGPTIGYAIRLFDNHLNIVPKVSYGLSHWKEEKLFNISDDLHSVSGGALVSYAINDQLGLGLEYSYQAGLNDGNYLKGADTHKIVAGPTYAISESFGFFAKATIAVPNQNLISDSDARLGCVLGFEFHW